MCVNCQCGLIRTPRRLTFEQSQALLTDDTTAHAWPIDERYCDCIEGLQRRENDAVAAGRFQARSAASRLGWRRRNNS